MGGQQSSESGKAGRTSQVSCYYEVLGVIQTASSDDIRKAYRRKALELHPDKNIDDPEGANRRFAELQTAYEILSDPQERAWYDSHRDAILYGDGVGESNSRPAEYRSVKVTSAEEIISLVGSFSAAVPFSDEPKGFFGGLRELFDRLATEEIAVGDYQGGPPPVFPTFGTSSDSFEDVVRPFYNYWSSFTTRKSFTWKDKYRPSDAPDRRMRRLMEKENKKFREDAIKEFNEAVRFLVNFSRKRDPRYAPNTVAASDRQKALRDAVAAQAARSRAANQEKLQGSTVPEWVQSASDRGNNEVFPSDNEITDSEVEHIECIVCNKTFKSENQYQAHERSKKHTKAVQELRRRMKQENANFDLEHVDDNSQVAEAKDPNQELAGNANFNAPSPSHDAQLYGDVSQHLKEKLEEGCDDRGEFDSHVPHSSKDESSIAAGIDTLGDSMVIVDVETESAPKIGKAKAKRDRKAARQAEFGAQKNPSVACNVCNEHFTSRTKLFTHIRVEGHATSRH
ncbi:hypothetical protein jhhlp_005656 [Lomentospora prolificans]|uniref:J domain-containing protein n=1 Tax=Lomentospora prolificans TaxID=41688 RepID=A0A2N3N3R9_9PEZI|nr:hypothetical protein jhhlp_005656 [Lomentospora prolificans]